MKRFVSIFISLALVVSLCPLFTNVSYAVGEEVLLENAKLEETQLVRSLDSGLRALDSAQDRKAYESLLRQATKVANGEESSTIFELTLQDFGIKQDKFSAEYLGVSDLLDYSRTEPVISDAAASAVIALVDFDYERVITQLIHSAPYELYWFDKTKGYSYSTPSIGYISNAEYPNGYLYLQSNVIVEMVVSAAYSQNGAQYITDKGACKRVQTSLTKAAQIVEKHKGKNDYEKLVAYKEEICNLASYDHEAGDKDSQTPYGNQWQLIWVFDGDPTTNVVCEGYAKAFQYLCQISDFTSSKIECISVNGMMYNEADDDKPVSENHMWNIVTMENGLNYIVDITNCDEGTIGEPSSLFLAGMTGSVLGQYDKTISNKWVTYVYGYDTRMIFSQEALTLSGVDYEHPVDLTAKNIKAINAGKNRVTITWDKVDGAEGYILYGRRGDSATFGYIGMTTKGTTYTDTNALDTDYNFYKVYPYITVAGKRVVGTSDGYAYAKGITAAPTGITAIGAGKGVVQIKWNPVAGADGYLIYGRHSKTGAYGYITMTTGATTAKDMNALDNDYNFYWVYPYHMKNGSRVIGSTPQYVYAKGVTGPITKANGLTASSISGGVKISWKTVKDADGYIIYAKRPGASSFSYIGMTTQNLYYTDKSASKSDWTFYRVFPFHYGIDNVKIVGESGDYVYGKAK